MTTTGTSTTPATFTNVTTYFADKMLMLLGNIIRDSGLSMTHFTGKRAVLELGIKSWLESGHLKKVTLEIYKPGSTTLIQRWDLDWDKCTAAEAGFWVDVADIKYHLAKAGVVPSTCSYQFIVDTKPGHPAVPGWGTGNYAATTGLKQFSVGVTISGEGHGSRTSYWR